MDAPAESPADTAVAHGMLAISPATVDLGSVEIGATSAIAHLTISNLGGAPVTGLTLAVSAEFSIRATTCAGALAAGASCTADVACMPTSVGTKTGTLTARTEGGETTTAQLVAAGHSSHDGMLTISPSSHQFGDIAVGTTSAVTVFTISNPGGTAIKLLAVASNGVDPTQFPISSDGCTGASLQPSQMCTVAVAFSPSSTGAKSATVSVTATTGSTVAAAVTGTAVSPPGGPLVISPSGYDFGSIAVTQTASKTFAVMNGGTTTAMLTSAIGGASATSFAIAQDGCTGVPLAPQASCTLTVQFQGMTVGSQAALLELATAGSTASAPLSGTVVTGVAAISVTPSTLAFGMVAVGAMAQRSFTVTNNGATATPSVTVSLAGSDPSQFAVGADGCTGVTLASGQSCTVQMNFAPMSTGAKCASVLVGAGTFATVALAGSGS